ncbi:hypothetical protein BSL82_15740 [Tardibacter chloracetimidivorans]|uniref:Uncharacterized protein n=1 Tax=Tardibacter chloracetimidivorans TaxID=1921510 RepID=A0A1L3ZY57_9SPHN|nr:hypothetical protein [Tardibacter chloracetimidivorans]API60557.1 hypothetical protein BSL82_15740 [Tardibacter chloracetimidivorans]
MIYNAAVFWSRQVTDLAGFYFAVCAEMMRLPKLPKAANGCRQQTAVGSGSGPAAVGSLEGRYFSMT